jgi:hypothetical protein
VFASRVIVFNNVVGLDEEAAAADEPLKAAKNKSRRLLIHFGFFFLRLAR